MDLNLQYFSHQISLLQAAETPSRLRRMLYLAAAGLAATRIRDFQRAAGAPAAAGWADSIKNRDGFGLGQSGCSL